MKALLRSCIFAFLPFVILLTVVHSAVVSAHVGSPDVFYEADAGPHHLVVTVRPPQVIPGVADIEVRATNSQPSRLWLLPVPLLGAASKNPPTADAAIQSTDDPQFFTGHLWIMATGAWQVRVRAEGSTGSGELSVPIPAVALRTFGMQRALGVGLSIMMIVLALGFISIVGASFREAPVEPGTALPPNRRRAGRIAMVASTVIVIAVGMFGNWWWNVEANAYSRYVYKPLTLEIGPRFDFTFVDPGWLPSRKVDDLVPDHGHPIHLFFINESTGTLYHVHPSQEPGGRWRAATTPSEPGRYRAFADIVHATGLPETAVGTVDVEKGTGIVSTTEKGTGLISAGDDSVGGPHTDRAPNGREFAFEDGGRMLRADADRPLVARETTVLRFDLLAREGRPATDLELYMGMPAHAVVVKRDWSVFAHVHSGGSVPMANLAMLQEAQPAAAHAHDAALPATVSFPYGFPSSGDYRVYVQVKRAGRVDTGVFDFSVGERVAGK